MSSLRSIALATALAGALAGSLAGCTGNISGDGEGSGNGSGNGSAGNGNGSAGNGNSGSGSPGSGNGGGGPGTPSPGSPPGTPGGPPTTTPSDPNAAGVMPLRRLTRREYNNTVRDLLGDGSRPADAFTADRESDFLFRRAGLVSTQDTDTFRDAAEAVAAAAEKNLGTLAPCAAAGARAAEDACARKFVTDFGLRAFRRPLDAGESERLLALYQTGRSTLALAHAGAIRLLIEAMLQSPSFLYHWESGNEAPIVEGKQVRLGHYETASRLSYFIWGSMPDQALFEAAAAGKLGTKAELEAQARRLLGDTRARDTVAAFVEEWLGLDQVSERPKDASVYPEFKDDLKAAMVAETRAFVGAVVFDGDGNWKNLLTSDYTFVNQPLAAVYGMNGVSGSELKKAPLNTAERAGLLTEASFLTVTGATDGSNPVKRGRRVYERLLCGELPPPPPDVPPAKPPAAGGTTRERFAEHSSSACAAGCHVLMDPLGFAFEHYDGIGRYRTTDNGKPVDASGSLELDGAKRTFADARELSRILADSPSVRRCFVAQWSRFAWGRKETTADFASLDSAASAFSQGGNSIRELLVGVVGSRSFRYRTPAEGEKLQ